MATKVPDALINGIPVEEFPPVIEQGIVPDSEPSHVPVPVSLDEYEGRLAFFRLVLAGSHIPGWKRPLHVGKVTMIPWSGPVTVQSTYVMQVSDHPGESDKIGYETRYEKITHRRDVGRGRALTVVVRPFYANLERLLSDMEILERESLAALGSVAAVFDERFALEELGENLVLMDSSEVVPERFVDVSWRVRSYRPDVAFPEQPPELAPSAVSPPVNQAARWYLKGSREGPTADGVMWLCTAIESLVEPLPGQSRRFNRKAIEAAIIGAQDDPHRFQPDIGRVAGLRASVVHEGMEDPELLHDGFYVLEEIARLLIRHRLSFDAGWPLRPSDDEERSPVSRIKRLANDRWLDE